MKLTKLKKIIGKVQKSDIFETLKHSKNYFTADIMTNAMGFVSIPIFTRLLTRADYGVVAVFMSYLGIVTILMSLYSYTAVSRYYYENKSDINEFLGTTVILIGLIYFFTIPIYILFYNRISGIMSLPGLLPMYLIFAGFFKIMYSLYRQILVPQRKSKEMSRIIVLKGYITFACAVLLVYLLKEERYLGQVWAILLVGFVFSIYFFMKLKKIIKLSFKIKHVKYILGYAVPLIPYVLAGTILSQFDRIMVNNIIGPEAAGLYSFGYKVGMLLFVVIGAISTAFTPDFFKFYNNKEYTRVDSLIKRAFSVVLIWALGLIIFAKEIVMILADKKFYPGLSVVPLVVIGYVFYYMFMIYQLYPVHERKTIYVSITAIIPGILNVVLNAIFIPKYGYVAGAYTTVISYLLMFLLGWIVAKVVLKKKVVPLWMIWKPTLIMFCFVMFLSLLSSFNINTFIMVFIKCVTLLLFSVIVFYKEFKIMLRHIYA